MNKVLPFEVSHRGSYLWGHVNEGDRWKFRFISLSQKLQQVTEWHIFCDDVNRFLASTHSWMDGWMNYFKSVYYPWSQKYILYWYKLSRVQTFAGINFRGDKLSRSPRAKINFREYKLSRMVPLKNLAGINFCDRLKFWWNALILTHFLVIFDRYFDKSYESSISRVQTFASGTEQAILWV